MFGAGCVVYRGVDRWAFSRGEESVLGRENGAICSALGWIGLNGFRSRISAKR